MTMLTGPDAGRIPAASPAAGSPTATSPTAGPSPAGPVSAGSGVAAADAGSGRESHRKPVVGQRARRSRKISTRDIELFTELTGDRNPLHYDAEQAGRSRFGGIIVQGGVTSGLLNAVVAEDLPGPGTVFLHVDWNFRAPVRPGDVITAEVEVLSWRDDKPIGRLRTTITRQDGTVVLDGEALVYREPGIHR